MPEMSNLEAASGRVFFKSSRMALVIGFGGLISIMAVAGIDALRSLRQFQRSDDQIRRRYLSQNHVLNEIRSNVYVSGTYVRDYLLEPDLGRAASDDLPDAYKTCIYRVVQEALHNVSNHAHSIASR